MFGEVYLSRSLSKKRCSDQSQDWCERDESKELSLLEEESVPAVRRGQDSRVVVHEFRTGSSS